MGGAAFGTTRTTPEKWLSRNHSRNRRASAASPRMTTLRSPATPRRSSAHLDHRRGVGLYDKIDVVARVVQTDLGGLRSLRVQHKPELPGTAVFVATPPKVAPRPCGADVHDQPDAACSTSINPHRGCADRPGSSSAVGPGAEGVEGCLEVLPRLGQPVFPSRRASTATCARQRRSMPNAASAQPARQQRARHQRDAAVDLVEAMAASEQLAQHDRRPALVKTSLAVVDRTAESIAHTATVTWAASPQVHFVNWTRLAGRLMVPISIALARGISDLHDHSAATAFVSRLESARLSTGLPAVALAGPLSLRQLWPCLWPRARPPSSTGTSTRLRC